MGASFWSQHLQRQPVLSNPIAGKRPAPHSKLEPGVGRAERWLQKRARQQPLTRLLPRFSPQVIAANAPISERRRPPPSNLEPGVGRAERWLQNRARQQLLPRLLPRFSPQVIAANAP